MFATANKPRGCGKSRKAGGVYAEVGKSPFGQPLEHFLIDPIIPIDPEEIGLPYQRPRVYTPDQGPRILDWIGKTHYPNVADFIEECRELGMSRRLELSPEEYSMLTDRTPYYIVIPDAWIDPELLLSDAVNLDMSKVEYDWKYCPKKIAEHEPYTSFETCAGWLWNRVDEGTEEHPEHPDYVVRSMPAFAYAGARSTAAFLDADPALFSAGIVACFTISRLAVVIDEEMDAHEDKIKKLRDCKLRVDLTEN